MTAKLKQSGSGQTLVLTISNPEYRNALAPEMYAAGVKALAAAASDGVRSVVIVGEGAVFCAGGNLQRLQANRNRPPAVQADSIDAFHELIDAIGSFPAPVIAAVEGAAAGAGFSLALACDFIVAAENAVFVMAYSNIGLSPDGGASWSLASAMPRQLASELLMCGERVKAQRLAELGIVNRVTPAGQAHAEALTLAHRLNGRAPNALASAKLLMRQASTSALGEHLPRERDHFVANLHHDNAAIGISSFLAKSTPSYR